MKAEPLGVCDQGHAVTAEGLRRGMLLRVIGMRVCRSCGQVVPVSRKPDKP